MSLSNDNKMKESNNIDEKKDEINKNLYLKFITLKNEFIKERQKISFIRKRK